VWHENIASPNTIAVKKVVEKGKDVVLFAFYSTIRPSLL
jgi:hypothetical protein